MTRYLLIVMAVASSLFAACDNARRQVTDNGNKPVAANANRSVAVGTTEANAVDAGAKVPDPKSACLTTNVGAKRAVDKKQTFAIDFEPFKGSCFVTSYDPEYGGTHEETQYEIYSNGKKVFSFPSQFNGSTFGCWVDGVAFQDLDKDSLTDIIVVGKCAAKQSDYNENMVYMNTGKAFSTREDANNQLGDLKTIKEITNFVADNKDLFF